MRWETKIRSKRLSILKIHNFRINKWVQIAYGVPYSEKSSIFIQYKMVVVYFVEVSTHDLEAQNLRYGDVSLRLIRTLE